MSILGYKGFSFKKSWSKISIYKENALDNLSFKVNEVVIYNWGYLIIPLFSEQLLIIYAILNRMFLGAVIPIRAVSDIYIHNLTQLFLLQGFHSIERKLKKLILQSFLLGIVIVFFVSYFHEEINSYWLNNKVSMDAEFLSAFAIFLLTNAILHPIGLFLISIGNHFTKMRNYSFFIMILTILLVTILLILNENEWVLLCASFVYTISLYFYIRAFLQLKRACYNAG